MQGKSKTCSLCRGTGETDPNMVVDGCGTVSEEQDAVVEEEQLLREEEKEQRTQMINYRVSLLDNDSKLLYSLSRIELLVDIFGNATNDDFVFDQMKEQIVSRYVQDNVGPNSPLFCYTLSSNWRPILEILRESGFVLLETKSYSTRDTELPVEQTGIRE